MDVGLVSGVHINDPYSLLEDKWAMQHRLLEYLKLFLKNVCVSCIALQGFTATHRGSVPNWTCALPRVLVGSWEWCPILLNKL